MQARPRRRALRLAPAVAAGALAFLGLAACAGPPGNARITGTGASGDGTLRVGLILDNTGPQSFLNAAQSAAARLAVKEINAAGGYRGRPVELLPAAPGEDTAGQARSLAAAGADAVIGPTDSSRAPAAIDVLSHARVAVISPANTASALSRYNSRGYYFRTAAADVAQAPVLVKLAMDAGARTAAVIREEGSYGKDVAAAVSAAATAAGLDPVAEEKFSPGQAGHAAAAAKAAAPDAVILISREGAQGAIAELNNAGLAGPRLILSDGAVAPYGPGLASRALEGARGILPGAFPSADFQARLLAVDPALKDLSFAAETYDAVILAALAAASADDDAGTSIAAQLTAVSGGTGADGARPGGPASACTTYQECAGAIRAGGRPDYDGESGRINFDARGDVTAANYVVYRYGADNLPVRSGAETAGSSGS